MSERESPWTEGHRETDARKVVEAVHSFAMRTGGPLGRLPSLNIYVIPAKVNTHATWGNTRMAAASGIECNFAQKIPRSARCFVIAVSA
jgi:hypothetical protein